ncbi:AbrB/MazE/SpoVT family DNA-binding domain-containing protein [Candidatus Woesearchaeota archaeon]|nr:AbrB/MazE/SpoVT family DNA-binding domain-containing protein [Candidatus Woesearchaeota archaeon]
MYLQKQLSKKIGNKEYAKWVLVVPPKIIEKLGWKAGEELEAEIKGSRLIIEKED